MTAFIPPNPPPTPSRLVRKRLVFYCPGYDREAARRYRKLFVTGLAQQARRFGIAHKIGPVEHDPQIPAQRWTVTAGKNAWQTQTIYEVLCWDDLVEADSRRGWGSRLWLLLQAARYVLRERIVVRAFRMSPPFAAMMLFPLLALLIFFLVALAVGYGLASMASAMLSLSSSVAAVSAVAMALVLLSVSDPLVRRLYMSLMLDAWIFNWQHATGRRQDFETRIDRFCERVISACRDSDADEVLIVGHSTGTLAAIQLMARLLRHSGASIAPMPALLTLGGELPFVCYGPEAEPLRQDIKQLATAPGLLWVDYQAPQDPLNAFNFDPVRDLGLDLGGLPRTNPVIRSPCFKDILQPKTYRKIRYNFFRLHFQFLLANENLGAYDYPMMICGPVSLKTRIEDPAAAIKAAYDPDAGEARPGA